MKWFDCTLRANAADKAKSKRETSLSSLAHSLHGIYFAMAVTVAAIANGRQDGHFTARMPTALKVPPCVFTSMPISQVPTRWSRL